MTPAPSRPATLSLSYEIPYDLDAGPHEVESYATRFRDFSRESLKRCKIPTTAL